MGGVREIEAALLGPEIGSLAADEARAVLTGPGVRKDPEHVVEDEGEGGG